MKIPRDPLTGDWAEPWFTIALVAGIVAAFGIFILLDLWIKGYLL